MVKQASGITTPCPSCSAEMPIERLTITIANGVCGRCNERNIGNEYAQPIYGFKNNGASLVKADRLAEHAENVKVAG